MTNGTMLRSVPVPFQAILWPLLGAALILAVGRHLPAWLRRLLAAAAAAASLAAIWSLRSGDPQRVEIPWLPLNLFRSGPALSTDGLAVPMALTLATIAVALSLGIGCVGAQPGGDGLLPDDRIRLEDQAPVILPGESAGQVG